MKRVLILGGSGRFGRHAAMAFLNAGWDVRTFDRSKDDLMDMSRGCNVIVAAWNPAYPDWDVQVPQLHKRIIAAAKASGASVIVPSNVYVYGKGSPELLTEHTPHTARNPLGRIRIDMERAYRQSGLSVLFLRAGDFIDTEASGNWFDKILIKPLNKGALIYPCADDIPHAWAYLPDMARAAVQLVERDDRPTGAEEILFAGYTLNGQDIAKTLGRITGTPISVRRMSWLPIRIAAPFSKMVRCLLEMRYLWNMPHHLDPTGFKSLLPEFEPTPVEDALAAATAHLRQ